MRAEGTRETLQSKNEKQGQWGKVTFKTFNPFFLCRVSTFLFTPYINTMNSSISNEGLCLIALKLCCPVGTYTVLAISKAPCQMWGPQGNPGECLPSKSDSVMEKWGIYPSICTRKQCVKCNSARITETARLGNTDNEYNWIWHIILWSGTGTCFHEPQH